MHRITEETHLLGINHYTSSQSISPAAPTIKVYRTRWYILGLFCAFTCGQATVWNTWSPISASATFVFPTWNDATFGLLSNWGPICFIVFGVPIAWLLNEKGLRPACVITAGLVSVGTIVRCIPVTANIGAFFNGISGVTAMGAAPLLSAMWFPPEERTTATGIASALNQLGNAVGSLLGPFMVSQPSENGTNSSSAAEVDDIRHDIASLMYTEAAITTAIFLLMLFYYPSAPPNPPSTTSHEERTEIKSAVRAMLTNRNVLMLTTAYCLTQGVFGGWQGVMYLNLKHLGISQVDSGWIAVTAICASCIVGIVVARFADLLYRKMKITIITLLTCTSVFFLYLALLCFEVIPASLGQLYVAIVLGTCFCFGSTPLFFELTVEIAYPVSEALIGTFITIMFNVVAMIFLLMFYIPNIGTSWMNYCLVAAPVISLPFVILTQEKYLRSDTDRLITKRTV